MENKYTLNTAPALTWNWLKSNSDFTELNLATAFSQAKTEYSSLPNGVTASSAELPVKASEFGSGVLNIPNPKFGDKVKTAQNARVTTAAKETNQELTKLLESVVKTPETFTINGKVAEPVILNLKAENNTAAIQNIYCKANSEATVVILYTGDGENQFVQTRLYAEEYAKVTLIKVQLLEKNSTQLDDTQIIEDDNADVHFVQIELGGHHVDSGLHTSLKGYQANFVSNVAYLCQQDQFLDMNHIVYHYGKKTECNMKVEGTLKDSAVKAYRGTIDFKNGCCGSKGNEMEETLLLSPTAVNKSLPVILCDEEDVEGEHGATIGRLSADILFYMESRGISEKEAEVIMSRAKIQAAADLIPGEEIKNLISDYLDKNI